MTEAVREQVWLAMDQGCGLLDIPLEFWGKNTIEVVEVWLFMARSLRDALRSQPLKTPEDRAMSDQFYLLQISVQEMRQELFNVISGGDS